MDELDILFKNMMECVTEDESKEESSVMNDLINFDYSNLDFKKLVNFKLKVIRLHKDLDVFVNKDSKGFDEITNGAYGYLKNRYKAVTRTAEASLKRCDYIIKHMKEEYIYQFIDAELHLSQDVLFGNDFSFHFGSRDNKDVIFKKGLLALKDQMALYQEALIKKNEIFQLYLGFEEGEYDGKHYFIDKDEYLSFKIIEPAEEKLVYEAYGINFEDWYLWKSSGIIDLNSKKFRKLNKKYFPEHFV